MMKTGAGAVYSALTNQSIDLEELGLLIRAIVGDAVEQATECQEAWFGLLRVMQDSGRGLTRTWQLFLGSAAGFLAQATDATLVADRLDAMAAGRYPLVLCMPSQKVGRADFDPARCAADNLDAGRVARAFNALSSRYGFSETIDGLFAVGCTVGTADQDREAVLAYIGVLAKEYREIGRREATAVTKH